MGPKKKGGKANKLARMTDEQRERYLQHRAAIEEETRRRKEQLIATFMRNKLKREEAFTRINSAKINQHWRHILRKTKCGEQREDLENLWHCFDRVMDQKQRQKDELLSSLEVAERQYSDTLQAHLDVVERLIVVHSEHVDHLKTLFSVQLLEHLSHATNEKALIHVVFERENQRLQVICMAMEMDVHSSERQHYKYEKVNKISEMKRKYKEDWESLVTVRERALEEIWKKMQETLNSYAADTAAKRKTVQQLRKMDQDWLQTLSDIQRNSRRVGQMKEHAENKINEISENNSNLQRQRDSMLHCYKMLVERVAKEKKRDDEKFEHLVITSDKILKHLNETKNKGEKSLAMLVLCQRFESRAELAQSSTESPDKEKHVLDGSSHYDDDDSDDDNGFGSVGDLEEKEMRIFGKLTNFWRKYNKVLIETTNARMKRDMLALENRQLKSTLQNYLSEMSRVDSCGASARPRTSFKTIVKTPQRPVSSRASSSAARPVLLSDRLSIGSSNSDQWSI